MGIFKKKSPNRIGNGLTYVEADTNSNEVTVYINWLLKDKWKS